jgi:hypothetical protein
MTEPSTPEQLLATALETLDSADRQRVTAWLLHRTSGGTGRLGGAERERLVRVLSPGRAGPRELFGIERSSILAGQDHQVVPVRLPTELHTRLREWSAHHGFSMATVVRGLVARFLDGQEA